MHLLCRVVITASLTLACCCLVGGGQDLRPQDAAWHSDYAKALAESRQSGKPLFIVLACLH
jgi:hypothetical protein